MKHPFEVGGTYRNRKGEYEVLSIAEPIMEIRYRDGAVVKTEIALQATIWENLQLDEEGPEPDDDDRDRGVRRIPATPAKRPAVAKSNSPAKAAPAKPAAARPSNSRPATTKAAAAPPTVPTLGEEDFQSSTEGVWRTRESFGGALAERLAMNAKRYFAAYPAAQRSQVQVAEPEYFAGRDPRAVAKYLFTLDDEGVAYGFYIEKSARPMDSSWQWPLFLAALRGRAALRTRVEEAMRRHSLQGTIELYDASETKVVARTVVQAGDSGLLMQTNVQDAPGPADWEDVVTLLESVPADVRCAVQFSAALPRTAALGQGGRLADTVVNAWTALLPLYEAATRRS